MIIFYRSAIIAGNPLFESPIKVRGSKTNLSDGPRRCLKKKEKLFLRGEFCHTKTPIFQLFWIFAKLVILISQYLHENIAYSKNGVYHDEGNGNARKMSSQIFDFQTFVTDIFWFKVSHFSFFKKFQKTQFFTNLAIKLRMHPEHLDQS